MKEELIAAKELVAEFDQIDEQIKNHMPTVRETFLLAMEIKERGLWRARFESWNAYCKERFGKTADSFRKLQERSVVRKMLAQTTGEKVERTLSEPDAPTKNREEKVINVSARVDREVEVRPSFVKPPPVPMRAVDVLSELSRTLDRLLKESAFAEDQRFRHCVTLAHEAINLMQPTLPGMEELASPKAKSRATVSDCVEYCIEQGLTELDGRWFFDKNQASGWKINGRAICDWKACVRAWKAQGFFPSIKNGGTVSTGADKMIRQKELERVDARVKTIRDQYDSHMEWSQKDREEFRKLKARRIELQKLLGVTV